MSQSLALLESLWAGLDLDNLVCSHCGKHVHVDSGLARTFSLASLMPSDRPYAQRLEVPSLSETVLIYHRHLSCLFESVKYAAISHVWHPGVADLQYRKHEATASVDSVAKVVQEIPVRICLGLAKALGQSYEVWHDYISVPQWQHQMKGLIIQSIPQIYGQAALTVAYLSDGEPADIQSMRHGKSIYEICRAVSNLCNAKWFSRVWTAMEYTQSGNLRTMLKDFSLVEQDIGQKPLFPEMLDTWQNQNRKTGNSFDTEEMIGMGYNLVPWQLGPLEMVRNRNSRGALMTFGTAHELLARRCVTIPRDFFHGLLGVLKVDLTESDLSPDTSTAMSQIAQKCILRGDFSSLLMVPASSLSDPDERDTRSYGYQDLVPYALGGEEIPPAFRTIKFDSGNPILTLESLGSVGFIKRLYGDQGDASTLPSMFRLILTTCGRDLGAVVKTIARLYGLHHESISQHLRTSNTMDQLQDRLDKVASSEIQLTDTLIDWMADVLAISNEEIKNPMTHLSPMGFLGGHGGSVHLSDASAIIGVDCPTCCQRFLIRIALLKKESDISNARAYRIPGLKYTFSLGGGTGFIVKDKQIVGRFVWAVPTCDCNSMDDVEVLLAGLPLPKPNMSEYGDVEVKDWLPVHLHGRINLS